MAQNPIRITAETPIYVMRLADTSFTRRLAAGHKFRNGHEMDAVQVSEDGELWHTVRVCCGEEVR